MSSVIAQLNRQFAAEDAATRGLPDLLIDPANHDDAAEEIALRVASRPDVFAYDGWPVVVHRSAFGAFVRRIQPNTSTTPLRASSVGVACVKRRVKGGAVEKVYTTFPKALRSMWCARLRKMQLRPLPPEFEPSKMAYRMQRTWWDADRHPLSTSSLARIEEEIVQWQRAMRSRAEHERGIECGPRTHRQASP